MKPRFLRTGPDSYRVARCGRRTAAPILVVLGLAAALVGTLPAVAVAADRPQYTLDNDPLRQGNRAFAQGDLDRARELYSEAVAAGHRLPDALWGLSRLDLGRGDSEAAEARCRQALAAAGGRFAEARAGLGLALLAQGRGEEADGEFAQALAEDPQVWAAHYGTALRLMAAGRWDEARPHLDRGAKLKGLDQGEDQFQHALALYLKGTGDLTGAEQAALKARHLNPADPVHGFLIAEIYLAEGIPALAVPAFEEALAVPGAVPRAADLHRLGRLYEDQNRFNEARDRYLQAVAADSTFAPALADLADLFVRAKRFDQAAGVLLRLADLQPDDLATRLDLADAFLELGRTGESLAAAREALRLAPDDPQVRFAFVRAGIRAAGDEERAEAAAMMTDLPDSLPWHAPDLVDLAAWQTEREDFAGAGTTLDRAARLDPALVRVPFQRGLLELRRGRPDDAAEAFARAVDLDPEGAANHLNLGIARYQAGDVAAAVPAFRRAVALRGDLTMARLLLAQGLAATDSLAAAEREYRAVLDREPQNAKALRGVGFCRLRKADYAAAATAYAAAAEAEPGNADGWAGLGSARLGQGDLDAAEAAYARARAIDPRNPMLETGSALLTQARNAGKENQ
ncbi:MAG: tetratricopeptide repeat protein [bacterium]